MKAWRRRIEAEETKNIIIQLGVGGSITSHPSVMVSVLNQCFPRKTDGPEGKKTRSKPGD